MSKQNLIACCLTVALTLPISLATTAANASIGSGPFYKKEHREKIIKEDRHGNRKVIKKDRHGNRKVVKKDRHGNRKVVEKTRYGKHVTVTRKRVTPKCENVVIKGPFGGKIKKRVCD
ncbi:MAG: hypothetical protein K0U59_05740 [Gammaproteobacteria bacterium]|nr:hypothetical protein [Gammaproteobacteria bacterium]